MAKPPNVWGVLSFREEGRPYKKPTHHSIKLKETSIKDPSFLLFLNLVISTVTLEVSCDQGEQIGRLFYLIRFLNYGISQKNWSSFSTE
jgi:hypothetical protein